MTTGNKLGLFKKALIGVVSVSVVVLVALVVLVKLLITPEMIKAVVVPLAESSLHRKVSLGDVKIHLFSGIELHDLAIADSSGDDPLLTVDVVRLRYQLLPLLAKRVVIDEILLERPALSLRRDAGGALNVADLLAVAGGSAGTPGEPRAAPAETPVTLLISEVRVEGGTIVFTDATSATGPPVRLTLSDVALQAAGSVLDGALRLQMKGQFNGAPLVVDGTLWIRDKAGQYTIDLQGLDALTLAPYYQAKLPGRLKSLKVDLHANVERSMESFSTVGTLTGRNLAITLDAIPTAPIDNATVRTEFDLAGTTDAVQIRHLAIDYNGLMLTMSGAMSGLPGMPLVKLHASSKKLDVKDLVRALPPGMVGRLVEMAPAGTLQADLELSGVLAIPRSLLQSARVSLQDVQCDIGGVRPALDGTLVLTGTQLATDAFTVRLGGDTVQVQAVVNNLYGKPVKITADLTAAHFPLEPLLVGSASAATVAGGNQTANNATGTFDLPIEATGVISLGKTGWQGLVLNDLQAAYTLRDNQLAINPVTGKVANGTFAGTIHVDLRQPGLAYQIGLDLQGVQADALVSAVSPPSAGFVSGTLRLKTDLNGSGSRWEIARRNLAGDGMLDVTGGQLAIPEVGKALAAFLQIPEAQQIEFTDLRSTFHISNGRLNLVGALTGKRFKLFPQGSIGLDGSLELPVEVRLSPDLAARVDRHGAVTRYLLDENGWTQVPLLMTGSLREPHVGLDPTALQSRAMRTLQQELQRGLEKLQGKPQQLSPADDQPNPASPAGQEPEPSTGKPAKKEKLRLEETFKQLLGR